MLIPSYFPLVGGSEVQLSGLLRKLDADKIRSFVLTRRLKGTPAVEEQGTAKIIRRRSPFRPAAFFLNSLAYLLRRPQQFDILHVHSFDSPALVGAIVKRCYPEKRLIILVPRFGEGSAFDKQRKSFWGRKRMAFVLKNADAVIPLCTEAQTALKELGVLQEKIAAVPNGVDIDIFRPALPEEKASIKQAMGIRKDAFVGIFTGRMIPRKNVFGALQAWQELVKVEPHAVLLIAGSGPEEEYLKAFARDHLPSGSVIFFGSASRDAIPRLFKASDVYVSFSASEGMSNAMLEALSTGVPVVACRGPGIDSLVRDGEYGFLVDPALPAEGVARLQHLCKNPDELRSMSEAARRLVEREFSFEVVAKRIEAIYFGRQWDDSNRRRDIQKDEAKPDRITMGRAGPF